METIYQLVPEKSTISLLQLTDMHLFADSQGELLGVNTAQSFQAVLEAIGAEGGQFDALLATGDLIQDNNEAGYQRFAQMVKPLGLPTFWLQGNHDCPTSMPHKLAEQPHIFPHKVILAGQHWVILMLDSQVYGSPHGRLGSYQLSWLSQMLTQFAGRHALICLHHNLLPTHSAWLDQHSLRNLHDLEDCLAPHTNVRAFLHGHIHQEVDSHWLHYRVLATPSTCIQFKPHCNTFTLDMLPQGWRELVLKEDGTIETLVKRLATNEFLPDFNSAGY
ncbi:3',5'-cyclic-AMP phosphodiesterase [Pasteurellaceae bacterium RH1A]|nr:3',5'-cyclic-AMP phosphodiesterase [Pasteurellaceae bacterium RH1A]